MFNNFAKKIFSFLFISVLALPLLATNLRNNTISAAENRTLIQRPKLYNTDGSLNQNFTIDFEAWLNDNIGFRSQMVIANAKMQYYLFNVLSNNSNMYLGPNDELNYATAPMLTDFQHLNLKSNDSLEQIAEGFQYANDYLTSKDIQLYYFQCWDKHSIYPEYFPTSVIQYGEDSKTDGIVQTLIEETNVHVISPKQALINSKSEYDTYSKWGDPTHWTQRGAFIGYQLLLNEINKQNLDKFYVLSEDDYTITQHDMGNTLFGGIHKECILENFEIKTPKAHLTDEKLTLYSEDQRHHFLTNNNIDNKTRVLVLGDSYFNNFIMDDIAESFYETLIIWGDFAPDFKLIIDTYHPDIVIIENAERCDRAESFARTFLEMKTTFSN